MNTFKKVIAGTADINFVRTWKAAALVSTVAVIVSLVATFTLGFVRGIEFEGGTSWEVPSGELTVEAARDVLRPLNLDSARVQTLGQNALRVQATEVGEQATDDVRAALAEAVGLSPEDIAVTQVGPSWGSQVSSKAIRALVAFFVVVSIYITIALREWRMAVAALVAVVHDIILSLGFYSLLRFEVTPATVIAFLTVLGYSLYDTVVVFDRVRANTPRVDLGQKMTYTEMVNLSTNQVLLRSVNTTITTLTPIISIVLVGSFLLGATTLREFGVALLVGLVAGVYSSLFIATPMLALLKEREPKYRDLRERLGRGLSEIAVGRVEAESGEEVVVLAPKERTQSRVTAGTGPRTAGPTVKVSGNIPARPRKKGRG